jgi:hypothetical protein
VYQQPRATRADHLRDAAEPAEERGADDAIAIDPERTRGEIAGRDRGAVEQAPGPRIHDPTLTYAVLR